MSRRVVVLSDTHMPRRGRTLPQPVLDALRNAELIIHLGDVTHMNVVQFLETFAPVRGVHGNNDTAEIQSRFPQTDRFTLAGQRIALVHGHVGGRTALLAARTVRDADIVLFGHSHSAYVAEEDGRLLLNPGSPTDPRWSPYRAFALLDIDEERIVPTIVPLR